MKNILTKALSKISNRSFFTLNIKNKEDNFLFSQLTVNDQDSQVVIVYGENGEGKSLIAKLIEQSARKDSTQTRSASMSNRTSNAFGKMLIFGDESKQSTGAASISSSLKCLSSTSEEEGPAIAVLDEPDIGLSDYYTKVFGEHIACNTNKFSANKGLVLISHSKRLINIFLEHYAGNVSTIGINTDTSLSEWLERDESATIEELLGLPKKTLRKQDRISNALERRSRGN